jgi:predicted small metal-binding protein
MENGIEHAKNAHNMKEEDITSEVQQKIKNLIEVLIIF